MGEGSGSLARSAGLPLRSTHVRHSVDVKLRCLGRQSDARAIRCAPLRQRWSERILTGDLQARPRRCRIRSVERSHCLFQTDMRERTVGTRARSPLHSHRLTVAS